METYAAPPSLLVSWEIGVPGWDKGFPAAIVILFPDSQVPYCLQSGKKNPNVIPPIFTETSFDVNLRTSCFLNFIFYHNLSQEGLCPAVSQALSTHPLELCCSWNAGPGMTCQDHRWLPCS